MTVTFCAARFGGLLGTLGGHVLVACAVVALDVAWIQSEMHNPNWDGAPDADLVFFFGVIVRVVLINTVLLPFAIPILYLRNTSNARAS
ncbi:MAG: hypothetical protein K8U03_02460 [Planctomycetia bacterium]|nr:hypothetical protein [Planctomycetia bacterium]